MRLRGVEASESQLGQSKIVFAKAAYGNAVSILIESECIELSVSRAAQRAS